MVYSCDEKQKINGTWVDCRGILKVHFGFPTGGNAFTNLLFTPIDRTDLCKKIVSTSDCLFGRKAHTWPILTVCLSHL